jgi:cytidylate kinase
MNPITPSQRSSEALMRAVSHWDRQRHAAGPGRAPAALTIAISRQIGARGTTVGRAVAERLGWPVYDHELLELIALQQNLRLNLLETVDERRTSWIEEAMTGFAEIPAVSEGNYARYLTETMLSLAAHGACVIVGRGAAQILPPASTLRVRLVAPLEDRIAWFGRQHGVTRDEAARRVTEADHHRLGFIRSHFRKDPTDPTGYDLVLNASRLAVAACADLVVAALHKLEKVPAS